MSFQATHDLLQTMKDLRAAITTERLNRYWPGFHVLPFALYDEKTVYLANHPAPPEEYEWMDGVHVGPWRSEFLANTSIQFAGEHVGIWNVNFFDDFVQPEEVYAFIIHEMFHAYQVKNQFQLDYNEMMLVYYPFTKENLTLLVQERRELLKAVLTHDPHQKREAIARFVAFREMRKIMLPHSVKYEMGLETYEGTATYVEYQALRDRSDLPEIFLLAQFGKQMPNYPKDLEWFRMTCYTPGLFMGLLLDEVTPHWKEEIFQSRRFIYDVFRETLTIDPVAVEMPDTSTGQTLAADIDAKRLEKVQEFYQSSGMVICLKGQMRITAFNPMQAIGYGDKVLHGMFLGLQSGSNTIFIQTPTLARHQAENMWIVLEAFTFVSTPPVVQGEFVQIDGIGEIRGSLVEENDHPCIYVGE